MSFRYTNLTRSLIAAALICYVGASGQSAGLRRQDRPRIRTSHLVVGRSVLVKSAVFEMGTDESEIPGLMQAFGVRHADVFSAEVPRHKVRLSSFYIDRYEVTNAEYRKFILKHPQWRKDKISSALHNGKYLSDWNGNEFAAGHENFPVVNVSWYAAVAYCQSNHMRLPTEAEWEYAARGGSRGKAFPWGDQLPDRSRANYSESGFGAAVAVGSYPANGYGIFDVAGNVWEYLSDEWQNYPASTEMQVDPVAGGDRFAATDSYLKVTTRRVIRGGSWGGSAINMRVTYRDSHPPNGAGDHVGFRCAMSAN